MAAWTCLAAAFFLAAAGCENQQPSTTTATPVSPQTKTVPDGPAAVASQLPAKAEKAVWRRSPDFTPPFPMRQDLFVPPDHAIAAKTARQVGDAEVALKGFAEFNGRCAILEINGDIVCLREGQEQSGIAVVAVKPPQVTLQYQGRQWTETLLRTRSAASPPASAS